MAQIISNKSPIDLNKRKAIGFGFPLNGDAVFVPTYQTKDQIQANLINFCLTNKKERFFNPNFGLDLRNLLFENITDTSLDELKELVSSGISDNFPQITVTQLEFINDPDINTINFILKYEIKLFGIEDEINIELQ
jgi:phage baseplate assembly protein W